MAEERVTKTLNNLIETCRDGEAGFHAAAERLKNASIRSQFEEFARERGSFADELRREIVRLGGEADDAGSVSGTMHRGWLQMKGAVTGDDESVISEAERGEDLAVSAYESALKESLPPDLQSIVQRQYNQVKRAHDRVRELERQHQGAR